MKLRHGLAAATLALGAASAQGCYQVAGFGDFEFVDPPDPIHEKLVSVSGVTKLDMLLVIDDSRQVEAAQEALRVTLDAFLRRLTNPSCVDDEGRTEDVTDALAACPEGYEREFPPLLDIHIGVVTSSIGGHGAMICEGDISGENQHAYLQGGVLVWDPKQEVGGFDDIDDLVTELDDIILGLGAMGCGFEAPLEAWYRFLVQPDPYERIVVDDNMSFQDGLDQTILDQRAEFLRPDSMVAIVLMSNENDCSMIDGGQSHLFADLGFVFPKPRPECEDDPNDPCCTSCAFDTPEGCPDVGVACEGDVTNDSPNLRCFDQKRRFGVDFLYPIDRYVNGLTSAQVPDRNGELKPNPLLGARDPSLVLFTAIVGVPWQDIARRNAEAAPDLDTGLDASGAAVGGIKNSDELLEPDSWALMLGDLANRIPPGDPFMIETPLPRSGDHPLVDESISTDPDQPNQINGFEVMPPDLNELQYACTFDLPTPLPGDGVCSPDFASPICDEDLMQVKGGATPGVRQLELVRRLGAQGTVGSACWDQLETPEDPSYGYMAAFRGSIVDRIKVRLRGQPCLPIPLTLDEEGRAACTLLEAYQTEPGTCTCDAPARRTPGDEDKPIVDRAKADPLAEAAGWNCFCFLNQPEERVDLEACRNYVNEPVVNEFGTRVDAWCYVDAEASPPIGAPEIVAACEEGQARAVRLVGDARPRPDASLFLDCE